MGPCTIRTGRTRAAHSSWSPSRFGEGRIARFRCALIQAGPGPHKGGRVSFPTPAALALLWGQGDTACEWHLHLILLCTCSRAHFRRALPGRPGLGFGPPSLCCQGGTAGATRPGLSLDGGAACGMLDPHPPFPRARGSRRARTVFGLSFSCLYSHTATP